MRRAPWLLLVSVLACGPPEAGEESVEEVLADEVVEILADPVERDDEAKLYHRGVAHYNATNYAKAKELLEEYTSRMAQDARPFAYLILGEIERAVTNHCGSLDLYEWAYQRGGRYIKHHAGVNLAYACLRCDRVERAKEIVDELMARPDIRHRKSAPGADLDITLCAAYVWRRMGHDALNATDYLAAIGAYSNAVVLRPYWPDFACDLARAKLWLGQVLHRTGDNTVRSMRLLLEADELLAHRRYAKWRRGWIQELRIEIDGEIAMQREESDRGAGGAR